jgi:heterodisulfide reductase subunit A-like polyferredoxin
MPSFAESPLAVDALVVGAGFGGIYQLKKLLDLGLQTTLIDFADDVGGTWFWVRFQGFHSYPCLSDITSRIDIPVPCRSMLLST